MASKRLPYLQFFPDDYLADEKLSLCSLSAQGLWMRLLCVMHKSDRRGYLQQSSGKPFSMEQIARVGGCSVKEAGKLVRELIESGVASVEDGILCNRRMARDEELRQKRSKAGSKGGQATGDLLKQNAKQTPSKDPGKSEASGAAKGAANSGNGNGLWDGDGISSPGMGGAGEGAADPDPRTVPIRTYEPTAAGCAQAWYWTCKRRDKFNRVPDRPEVMEPQFAELIRIGHDPDRLLSQILDPDRVKIEPFFQFSDRMEAERKRSKSPDTLERIKAIAKARDQPCKSGTPTGAESTPKSSAC